MSLTKGIYELAGALIDTACLVVSVSATPYTLVYDFINVLYCISTGAEYSSLTGSLWNLTKDAISIKFV